MESPKELEIHLLSPPVEAEDDGDDSSDEDDELCFSTVDCSSISGKIKAGYFSMERACQTEKSDIVSLKETTDLLKRLVQEIKLLKKNLYYTKLSLQAAYETNIQSRAIELYQRINDGVLKLEKTHVKKIDSIRRSFRTQLENAIQKLSQEYLQFYSGVSEQEKVAHQEKVLEIEKMQEEQRKAQLAQQDLIDMMRLQMNSEMLGNNDNDQDDSNSNSRSQTPLAEYVREIEELKENTYTLECKVEELEDQITEGKKENKQLGKELERAKKQSLSEQKKYAELRKEVIELQIALENERKATTKKLEEQKLDLQKQLKSELSSAEKKARVAAEKILKEMEAKQAEELKEQKLLEQKRLEEIIQCKEEREEESIDDNEFAVLKRIEKKQRQEIARLRKELDKAKRISEIKVGVLQQNLHALKDEMFLRISLQRQTAKLQHAAVSYSTEEQGVAAVLEPCKSPPPQREFQLPSIVQAGVKLTRAVTADSITRSHSVTHRPFSFRNKVQHLSFLRK